MDKGGGGVEKGQKWVDVLCTSPPVYQATLLCQPLNGARGNLRAPFQKLGYFLNEIGKGDTVKKISKQDQCVEGCVRNKAATYIFCTQGASLFMLLLTATVQATEQKNRQQIPAHFSPPSITGTPCYN